MLILSQKKLKNPPPFLSRHVLAIQSYDSEPFSGLDAYDLWCGGENFNDTVDRWGEN